MPAHLITWIVTALFCGGIIYNAWRIWQSFARGVASFDAVQWLGGLINGASNDNFVTDLGRFNASRRDFPRLFWTIVVLRGIACAVLGLVVLAVLRS